MKNQAEWKKSPQRYLSGGCIESFVVEHFTSSSLTVFRGILLAGGCVKNIVVERLTSYTMSCKTNAEESVARV